MNQFKSVVLTVLAFFALSGTVFFASCESDPCLELSCKNGGSCANGTCQCPAGYEGAECEIKSADRFIGKFAGYARCGIYPAHIDTAVITLETEPDQVTVKIGLGGTSLLNTTGTAVTPHIVFPEFNDGSVRVIKTATIDKDRFTFYMETYYYAQGTREVCSFDGIRINDSL